MRRQWVVCVTFCALIGCGGEGSGAEEGTLSDGSSSTPSDVLAEPCTPDSLACIDATQPGQCDANGALTPLTPCEVGQTCRGGQCRGPLCTPSTATCVGWSALKTCSFDGLYYEDVMRCPDGEICHEGRCQVCVPGQATCATMAAYATCDEDGQGFPMETINSCEGITNCHEPSGLCLELSCSPGEAECAGGLARTICLESGTGYKPDRLPCEQQTRCIDGQCIDDPCAFEPVLFVVDRTDIVAEDWDAYREAIAERVDAMPDTMYGFMPYPMAFGCPEGLPEAPQEPIGKVTSADIERWFNETISSAGEAPLERVFEAILKRVEENFAGRPARIILMSAGRATCGTDLSRLTNIVATLHADYDIQTYVLGHRITPTAVNPTLSAIVEAGGSGWEDFERTYYASAISQAIERALTDLETCPTL